MCVELGAEDAYEKFLTLSFSDRLAEAYQCLKVAAAQGVEAAQLQFALYHIEGENNQRKEHCGDETDRQDDALLEKSLNNLLSSQSSESVAIAHLVKARMLSADGAPFASYRRHLTEAAVRGNFQAMYDLHDHSAESECSSSYFWGAAILAAPTTNPSSLGAKQLRERLAELGLDNAAESTAEDIAKDFWRLDVDSRRKQLIEFSQRFGCDISGG